MRNAHLRLGLLEYQRATEKISTRIRVRVDRYIGEDRKAHLLSAFGNDSDIGAITAAIHEKATFTLSFPDDISCDDDLHSTFTLRLVLSSHDLDRVAVWNRLRFSSALADASRDENVLAHLREEKRRAWLCGLD